jgi:hypothetical protein
VSEDGDDCAGTGRDEDDVSGVRDRLDLWAFCDSLQERSCRQLQKLRRWAGAGRCN